MNGPVPPSVFWRSPFFSTAARSTIDRLFDVSAERTEASGYWRCSRTVTGSTAVTLSTASRYERAGEAVFGSSTRWIVNTTSSAVIGVPSWNFTPGTRWNTYVRLSGVSHDVARSPTMCRLGSYFTSLLYMRSTRRNDANDVTLLGSRPTASWSMPSVSVTFDGAALVRAANGTAEQQREGENEPVLRAHCFTSSIDAPAPRHAAVGHRPRSVYPVRASVIPGRSGRSSSDTRSP